MPEIKHTFQGGRMNKDLDERLVPNGEYRDAMNIQVKTSDGDALGTVQNIQGNSKIPSTTPVTEWSHAFSSHKSKVIASVSDEKNDKAYFFVSAPEVNDLFINDTSGEVAPLNQVINEINQFGGVGELTFIDTIIELKTGSAIAAPEITPVVVDKYAIVSPKTKTIGSNSLPDTPFVTFNVLDASKYRVGMKVQALRSTGSNATWTYNQFNENAFIRSIDTVNNTITLTNEQSPPEYAVSLFIFEHPDRPLNFNSSKNITGINIVDNLLFWTDNKSEPKKINITRSIDVTSSSTTHTKLKLNNPEDGSLELMSNMGEDLTSIDDNLEPINDELKEEHVTVIRRAPRTAPTIVMKKTNRDGKIEATVGTEDNKFSFTLIDENNVAYIVNVGQQINISADDFELTRYIPDDIITFTNNEDEESEIDVVVKAKFISYIDANNEPTNEAYTNQIKVEIIAKSSNLTNMGYIWTAKLELKKPLFEKKFCRFGYRYRYEDGEYSSFSPWSEIAFLPGPFDFIIKKGYNLGMVNELRELIIKDFLPIYTDRPYDVKSIDVLYKTTDSPNVHIVQTINRGVDKQWEYFTPGTNNSNLVTGELHVSSEMIHRTVPSDQMLRSWDNVPKTALSQEITANRLLFGNYTQGYDLDFQLNITPSVFNGSTPTTITPQKSIKSIRQYKIGFVFGDKYGRETPVIESKYTIGNDEDTYLTSTGDIELGKEFSSSKNMFNIAHDWSEDPPDWMDYIKYYIKETSNEYYNLVMDRWYDARDGNIWISFSSADRNKVDEETYLILKNANGSNDPVEEKARYKIIAISNEAPDFVKTDERVFEPIYLDHTTGMGAQMFDGDIDPALYSPTALMRATSLNIPQTIWQDYLDKIQQRGNLRMRICGRVKTVLGVDINKACTPWVTLSHHTNPEGDDPTVISWNEPFNDLADMFTRFGGLNYSTTGLKYYLDIKEDVVENKPEFDGRFFVKIEKDVTIDQQIVKTTPSVSDWETITSHAISYIDTRRFNPANSGPYSQSVVDAAGYNSGIYTWGKGYKSNNSLDATLTWANDRFTDNTDDPLGSPSLFKIRKFAVGCYECDVDWAACAGRNTKYYWKDWNDFVEEHHADDIIFIDSARSAKWYWDISDGVEAQLGINQMTNEELGEFYYEEYFDPTNEWHQWNPSAAGGLGADADEGGVNILGSNVAEISGKYFKPAGLDSSPDNPTDTLNRITFSIIKDSWDADSASSSKYKRFRAQIQEEGSLFRFGNDPDGNIYRVVSIHTTGYTSSGMDNITSNYRLKHPDGMGNNYTNASYTHLISMEKFNQQSPSDNFESDGTLDYTNNYYAPDYVPTWGHPDLTDMGSGNQLAKDSCTIATGGSSSGDDDEVARRSSIRVQFEMVNPATGAPYEPGDANYKKGIDTSVYDPRGYMRHDGTTTINFQFVSKISTGGGRAETSDLAACWETEPKKDADLDLYYEASNAIPIRLKKNNTLSFAPINSKISAYNIIGGQKKDVAFRNFEDSTPVVTTDQHVESVSYTANSSIVKVMAIDEDDNDVLQKNKIGPGTNLEFTHSDGTVTTTRVKDIYDFTNDPVPAARITNRTIFYPVTANADEPIYQDLITVNNQDDLLHGMMIVGPDIPPGIYLKKYGTTTKASDVSWMDQTGETIYNAEFVMGTGLYELEPDTYKYDIKLGWFNCYSFGNGVESDRIRDDFNAPQIDNGVKVSSTFIGYKEEQKKNGLIYSGLYNSISETNNLNEFNMAEKITKDLNPSYGSIQALKTRENNVVVFTEDKVLKVLANKDALYNADGNSQLVSTNRVLGDATPFAGDYGISQNPESLSKDQYRLYFTDKQRGAVLRLSNDGLTPISNIGMKDWFRDNLRKSNNVLGTFDVVNGEYNLTLTYNNDTPSTTVSFNEASKGWVSFKSYLPEAGTSVSGKYFTGLCNYIYKHYAEDFNNNGGCDAYPNPCSDRNTFYGEKVDSSVNVLFNDLPGSVKSFRTMNYEGSKSKIQGQASTVAIDEAGNTLTSLSDGEFYNLNNRQGWWVESFETDIQSGKVINFKSKENKWFNNIQGLGTFFNSSSDNNLDSGEFSVQGLGKATSIIIDNDTDGPNTSTETPKYTALYRDNSSAPVSLIPNYFTNEGSIVTMIVNTSNVPMGTTFTWTTSNTQSLAELYGDYSSDTLLNPEDFSVSGDLTTCLSSNANMPSGTGTIGADGTGVFYIGICADYFTESSESNPQGYEVFYVSITSSSDGTSTLIGDSSVFLNTLIVVQDTSTTLDENGNEEDGVNDINSNGEITTQHNLTISDVGDED